jgi:outer membrane protein, heavy metal efflux system
MHQSHARSPHALAGIALIVLMSLPVPSRGQERTAAPESLTGADSALSLRRLELAILARNPGAAVARAAWAQARARAELAGARPDPMVDLMLAPRSLGSDAVRPAYRLGVTQSFALFGQQGLRRAAARSEARSAGFELRTAQLELVRMGRMAYYEYFRIARSTDANRELASLVEQLRRVALARYGAGTVDQADPLRAEVETAMLDHEAVDLERQRIEVVALLNILLHRPVGAALPTPPLALALPDTLHHDAAGEHARTLQPELRAADARVEAAEAASRLAHRERLPNAAIGVVYDRYMAEPELRTSVTMSLNLPLGLPRLAAAEREARARVAMAEAEREVLRDSVALDVARASAWMHEQAHEVEISGTRMVPLSERALRAARASYESGRGDFTSLIGAMRDHLRARLDYYGSLAMLYEARADFDRAIGDPGPLLEAEEWP